MITPCVNTCKGATHGCWWLPLLRSGLCAWFRGSFHMSSSEYFHNYAVDEICFCSLDNPGSVLCCQQAPSLLILMACVCVTQCHHCHFQLPSGYGGHDRWSVGLKPSQAWSLHHLHSSSDCTMRYSVFCVLTGM